jgi:hypothetical protein
MALQRTNLLIEMARIPATFKGTPDEFSQTMVRRMRIVSPTGTNFIFIGDVEPTSNVGPWLKGGTQWFVFDEDLKRYVPLDISESEKDWYFIGASTPTDSTPPVWLKTTKDQSEADPSVGNPISWHVFNGSAWVPYVGVVLSGPTSARPASPAEYQRFFDTDISVEIWWQNGKWRTIAGSPGDTKFVSFETLEEALERNPGWNVFGASNQAFRGRYISQATKDSGATPTTVLTTGAGVAQRGAFETYGETDGVQIDPASTVPYPPSIALWFLVKE